MNKVVISILFLLFVNFIVSADENVYVVHTQNKNYFSIDNHDLTYDKNDTNYWIKFGDLVRIEDIEIQTLPGGSYREHLLITHLETNVSQYFWTRIVNDEPKSKIAKIEDISQNIHPKYFNVTLEDGAVYEVIVRAPNNDYKNYKGPYLAVGDEISFDTPTHPFIIYYFETPHHVKFRDVKIYRKGQFINSGYTAEGPHRKSRPPLEKNNVFHILETLDKYGTRVIVFKDFAPWNYFEILSPQNYEGKGKVKFKEKKSVSTGNKSKNRARSPKEDHFYFVDENNIELVVVPRYYNIRQIGPIRM